MMMNLQEMQTIIQYDLPVKIIVFSNDGYGAIRQTSKNFFEGEYIGCTPDTGVSFPSYRKIAQTFGFSYMQCATNGDLDQMINTFFSQEGHCKIRIFCSK